MGNANETRGVDMKPAPIGSQPSQIGPVVVYWNRLCASASGQTARLTPKSAAVLLRLLESPAQTVTREQLFTHAWPGSFSSDNVLSHVIKDLRLVLLQLGGQPDWITTIPRVGYCWDGPAPVAVSSDGETRTALTETIEPAADRAPIPPLRGRIVAATVGGAFIVAALWMFTRVWEQPHAPSPARTIAASPSTQPAAPAADDASRKDMLDRGHATLLRSITEPQARSDIQVSYGKLYWEIGRVDDAHELFTHAVATQRHAPGAIEHKLAFALGLLAVTHHARGDIASSTGALDEAQGLLESVPSRPTKDRIRAMLGVAQGWLAAEQPRRAIAWSSEAVTNSAALFGIESAEYAKALATHARVQRELSMIDEGLATATAAVAALTRLYGANDPTTINESIVRESLRIASGDASTAKRWFSQLLADNASLPGDPRTRAHAAHFHLAIALQNLGEFEPAEAAFAASAKLLGASELYGSHHAADVNAIARFHMERGDWAKAEALLRDLLARTTLDEGRVVVAQSWATLGEVLLQQGRLDESEAFLRRSQPPLQRAFGGAVPAARVDAALGELARRRGDRAAAARLLAQVGEAPLPGDAYDRLEVQTSALESRARAQADEGELVAALETRRSILEQRRRMLGEAHPLVAEAEYRLALDVAATSRAEALVLTERAWEGIAPQLSPHAQLVADVERLRGSLRTGSLR